MRPIIGNLMKVSSSTTRLKMVTIMVTETKRTSELIGKKRVAPWLLLKGVAPLVILKPIS